MLSFYFSLPRFHLLLKQMVKRLLEITLTAAVVIFSCRGGKCNGTHHRGSGGSNHNNDRSEIYPRIEATNSGSGTWGAKIAPRVNVAKATKAAATTIVTTGAMAATTPPLPLPSIAQSHTPVVTLALAKESSSVGRALTPHSLASHWLRPSIHSLNGLQGRSGT